MALATTYGEGSAFIALEVANYPKTQQVILLARFILAFFMYLW